MSDYSFMRAGLVAVGGEALPPDEKLKITILLMVFFKKALNDAAQYAQGAGRHEVLVQDLILGMKKNALPQHRFLEADDLPAEIARMAHFLAQPDADDADEPADDADDDEPATDEPAAHTDDTDDDAAADDEPATDEPADDADDADEPATEWTAATGPCFDDMNAAEALFEAWTPDAENMIGRVIKKAIQKTENTFNP